MPATRKLVRDAMRTALSYPTYGFNSRIAAVASTYGIDPFSIDWSPDSTNFTESYVAGQSERDSKLSGIHVAIYTSLSSQSSGGDRPKGSVFHGEIQAHLDFTLQFREGIELTEDLTEGYADAVEDAVIAVLLDPRAPNATLFCGGGPITYSGDFACAREPILSLDDGYSQRLPFTFIYEVHI